MSQAAREFLARGASVRADVANNKLTTANVSALSKTAQEVMTGAGGPLDHALRLFRTEINRAHGEAYMMSGANHPDFAGWRYLLSPAHPAPEICDLLSTQNLYGLGPGVYPDRERCPWPAHPNTLSYLEIAFKDEITAADRAGKETPLAALARLTPEQRGGVLGKGKAAIHDAGQLTQGMIRAPLQDVRARLEKRGELDTRDELTKKYFGGEGVAIERSVVGDLKIGRRTLSDDDLRRLAGAPDRSRVRVQIADDGDGYVGLMMEVKNALFEYPAIRVVYQDDDGMKLMLRNSSFMIRPSAQKNGLGLRSLAIEATSAAEFGLAAITADAAGGATSSIFSGYYAWPRMGFDARLTASEVAKLSPALKGSETILDLMASNEGMHWWKAMGTGREMVFDLSEGSQSWQTLRQYLHEEGVRL